MIKNISDYLYANKIVKCPLLKDIFFVLYVRLKMTAD